MSWLDSAAPSCVDGPGEEEGYGKCRNPGTHQSYLVALGAPGPAVLSAWMSGVVVEKFE